MTMAEIIDRFDSMFKGIAGEPVETRISEHNPALVIVKFASEGGRDKVVRFHEQAVTRRKIPFKIRNVRGLEVRFDVKIV